MNIRKLLGRDKTAATYREALRETSSALDLARAARSELEARRPSVLVDGTDEDLDKLESEIASRAREIDRLEAVAAELGPRIKAAERAEALADQERRKAAANAAHAEAVELLDGEYRKAAERIQEILVRVTECKAVIKDARDNGAAIGELFKLPPPEQVLAERAGRTQWASVAEKVVLPLPHGLGAIFDGGPKYIASLGGGFVSVNR